MRVAESQSLKVAKETVATAFSATLRLCDSATLRVAALAAFLLLAQTVSACPVCWGNPNDPMVKSANNGIWVLLGVVAFVQIGFAALFISFWRRAKEQKRFRESLHVIEGGPLS